MIDPKILSHIAHELRAPLTAMRGFLSLLLQNSFGKIPDESKEILNKMHEDVKKEIYLINDLSALLKVEVDNDTQKKESISLMPFVNEVVDFYTKEEELAGKAKIKVEGPDEEMNVLVPSNILKLMISFILKYIVRNNKEGCKVLVSVVLENSEYKIFIKDSAEKIDIPNQDELFQPFVSKLEKGSGIELFNCKELTSLIPNSKIGLLPEYKHGNTFYISFLSN